MRILCIGDIVSKTGVKAIARLLPSVVADRRVDFVVANGENAAGGVGLTPDGADELLSCGIDVLTTGNHVWRHRELRPYIEDQPRLLRPYNYPAVQPGRGFGLYRSPAGVAIGVVNLVGQVFMDPADNPFAAADRALEELSEASVVVVDMHAEVTSEKRAMGFHLDGRVAAVVGTHTHVQTADEQILPGGTAYVTDLGMTGPHDSVIGMRKDLVLGRFSTGLPCSFKPARGGGRLQGVLVEVDETTGLAGSIDRVDMPLP